MEQASRSGGGRRHAGGSAKRALDELAALAPDHGPGLGPKKLARLVVLEEAVLPRATDVVRLHEALVLLRAYPDDAHVLAVVERMLSAFRSRRDLRRHRAALADTGIAGTRTHYAFYFEMAKWLVQRCPGRLHVDWAAVDRPELLEQLLPRVVLSAEIPAVDELVMSPRDWVARLKGPDETDAEWLVRRCDALRASADERRHAFESLELPLYLDAGDRPSRTHAHHPIREPVFQRSTRSRERPDLRRAVRRPPKGVRILGESEALAVVDLAREAMASRLRDLDAIANADARDVRVFDCGDGLDLACIGLLPERRLMLEAVHVFLLLENGVPIGYFQAATLFGASELNYNVFPPYRGAESALNYAHGVSVVHAFLGSDTFAVDPYQLGIGNEEALRTGAFWFYEKLGFRPVSPVAKRALAEERAAIREDPRHRSSPAALRALGDDYLFLHLGKKRDDVVGKLSYGRVGLAASREVAERFGADRERATRVLAKEALAQLGASGLRGFTPDERRAFERWAPIVAVLPGVARWPLRDKRALVEVIRSKGGRAESDYVQRFGRHRRLWRALATLAR